MLFFQDTVTFSDDPFKQNHFSSTNVIGSHFKQKAINYRQYNSKHFRVYWFCFAEMNGNNGTQLMHAACELSVWTGKFKDQY